MSLCRIPLLIIAIMIFSSVSAQVGLNVTYVGLSAAVVSLEVRFDSGGFINAVAATIAVPATRLVLVTFGPSAIPNLLIVDFAIVDWGEVSDPSSATLSIALLGEYNRTTAPLQLAFNVTNMINDPTVRLPEGTIAPGTDDAASYPSRDPGNTPSIVMWVLVAVYLLYVVGYMVYYWNVLRKDQSLHYDPTRHLVKETCQHVEIFGLMSWRSESDVAMLPSREPQPTGGEGPEASSAEHTYLDELLPDVALVAVGRRHIVIVSRGDVYVSGSNDFGQLGIGEGSERPVTAYVRNIAFIDVEVLQLACGADHTLLLCDDGVYSWGRADDGQLGRALGKTSDVFSATPVLIGAFSISRRSTTGAIISVACGTHHSFVLTSTGLFAFGRNVEGQLCLPSVVTANIFEPQLVEYFSSYETTVRLMACGTRHTFIVCNNTDVYACGVNDHMQMGVVLADDASAVRSPRVVHLHDDTCYVHAIATCATHTVVACDNGVYVCGDNTAFCRLGTGVPDTYAVLKRVTDKVFNVVSTSVTHTLCLATESGLLVGWGRGLEGEFGAAAVVQCNWQGCVMMPIEATIMRACDQRDARWPLRITNVVAMVKGTLVVLLRVDDDAQRLLRELNRAVDESSRDALREAPQEMVKHLSMRRASTMTI